MRVLRSRQARFWSKRRDRRTQERRSTERMWTGASVMPNLRRRDEERRSESRSRLCLGEGFESARVPQPIVAGLAREMLRCASDANLAFRDEAERRLRVWPAVDHSERLFTDGGERP